MADDELMRALLARYAPQPEATLADVLKNSYRSPIREAVEAPQPIKRNAMNVWPLSPENKMWLDVRGDISKDPIGDEGFRLGTLMGGVRVPMSSLPMDEASRLARARELGFQVDSPMWHGTKSPVSSFDLRRAGKSDPGLVGRAVYGSPEREQAGQFAMSPHYGRGDAPNVMPLYHRMENPAIIQDGRLPDGRTLSEAHPRGITKESGEALRRQLMEQGYDGAIFKIGDEVTQYAVFDPSKVRSQQATFDPTKRLSSILGD